MSEARFHSIELKRPWMVLKPIFATKSSNVHVIDTIEREEQNEIL